MGRWRILRMPSPAMVVACIALAIALSGASYAAVVLPRNSVGTKQLRNNAVKGAKVAPDTLSGLDINEGTLGQVPSAVNAQNAANATNAQNAAGLACAGCVGATDLADGAVTSDKIADGQVVGTKLGLDAVTSNKISDRTVQSIDVGLDALSGAVINEASLGRVPAATSADFLGSFPAANYALHAKLAYSETTATGAFFDQIFNWFGLQLQARCGGGDNLIVRATTTNTNAWMRVGALGDSDFQPGENLDLDFGSGSFVGTYSAGGVVINLVLSTWENGVGDDCRLFGYAYPG